MDLALALLPEEQQTVIHHSYGLHNHASSHSGQIRQELGWTRRRTYYQRAKMLALALAPLYPRYADQHLLETHLSQKQRECLDCARFVPGAVHDRVGIEVLKHAACVDTVVARTYLME
ncbi:MAG TPA: hypothetical protein VGF67_08355 [Ktedonobacteraceae bacterium]